MGLNMSGHISGPFVTHIAELKRCSSAVVDFEPVFVLTYEDTFPANIQAATDREIEFLQIGAERIDDVRVLHRNDGLGIVISGPGKLADLIGFDGSWWKSVNTDYRPWHNFCRATVVRLDPAEAAKIIPIIGQPPQPSPDPVDPVDPTTPETFEWDQSSPAMVWTIPHNLGRYPSVTLVDSAGAEFLADVKYIDNNIVQITSASAVAGRAYLN